MRIYDLRRPTQPLSGMSTAQKYDGDLEKNKKASKGTISELDGKLYQRLESDEDKNQEKNRRMGGILNTSKRR